MAQGVPEKNIRRAITSILARQSPKIRWGEALALLGLALGLGSWLYMVLNPAPQFYTGLLLTLGTSASLCGFLCLVIPRRLLLKALLSTLTIIASVSVYLKYGTPLVAKQPDTLTALGRIEGMIRDLPNAIVRELVPYLPKQEQPQPTAKPNPSPKKDTPPTLLDLFRSDFPTLMHLDNDKNEFHSTATGESVYFESHVYLDF
jgi:hypothetical protein